MDLRVRKCQNPSYFWVETTNNLISEDLAFKEFLEWMNDTLDSFDWMRANITYKDGKYLRSYSIQVGGEEDILKMNLRIE